MAANDVMRRILDKIREYDTILLFRHIRMDGDCVGATLGMQALLRASFPEKRVLVIDSQHSDYLDFAGQTDPEVPDEVYATALGIVLDCSDRGRISNPKFTLCRELIKIDHHIVSDPFGDPAWVEEERSAACEMVAAFYEAFSDELILTREAATWIYMGMVTDSGRFRFSGVNGDTFRLAALMLDAGVDTETLYAHLYLHDFSSLRFKAYVYEHMRQTENGVAWLRVDAAMRERFSLSFEDAAEAISYMEGIRGCLCWLVFIDYPDGSIRVRLRSRFMTVNEVASHYHGGGHATASGSTVYSWEEAERLIAEADAATGEFKRTHEGWM